MKSTQADSGGAVERRNAGRRCRALVVLAAAALLIGLVASAAAEAPVEGHSRAATIGAGPRVAGNRPAPWRRRAVTRRHSVDSKPVRGAKPPAGPPAGAAPSTPAGPPSLFGAPVPNPGAVAPAGEGAPASPGERSPASAPPITHGVEVEPPSAEEPNPPSTGEPSSPPDAPETPEAPPQTPETPESPPDTPETPESPQTPETPESPPQTPEEPSIPDPPPPPPVSAPLLFAGSTIRDFDLVQAAPGAITEVPDPLGSGETVLRMTVADGDVAPITPTDNPRAQILTPDLIEAGDEFWLKTKFLVPQDFPTVPGWLSLVSIYGPPFASSSPWQVEVIGDHLQWARNRSYGFDVPWEAPLPKGAWVTLLLHERFAADGFVEMWIDGRQVTFFSGGGYNPENHPATTKLQMQTVDSSNDGGANAAKIMNYRQAGMFESDTVFFGPLLLGETRASIEG